MDGICAFSYVFGDVCLFSADAYVRVGRGGALPPENISIGAGALSEYKIRSKSRVWKIRDRDIDVHQDIGTP